MEDLSLPVTVLFTISYPQQYLALQSILNIGKNKAQTRLQDG